MSLMALGMTLRGLAVSAAVIPTISIPANEKMTIWKDFKSHPAGCEKSAM